jgi:hypothetical protein
MIIHVEAKDEEAQEILKEIVPTVFDGFIKLEKLYPEIVLPERLTLQCFRKQTKPAKTFTCALCGHKPHKGEWYIKVRRTINGNFSKQDTILHEIAHIGEALLTGKWGHGKTFWTIFGQLKDSAGYSGLDLLVSIVVWYWVILGLMKLFKHLL